MDLSPSLIEAIIMAALSGLGYWLYTFKEKYDQLKDKVHGLELDLAKNYHGKEEIKEMLKEALHPINETMKEVKNELRELRKRDDAD